MGICAIKESYMIEENGEGNLCHAISLIYFMDRILLIQKNCVILLLVVRKKKNFLLFFWEVFL